MKEAHFIKCSFLSDTHLFVYLMILLDIYKEIAIFNVMHKIIIC